MARNDTGIISSSLPQDASRAETTTGAWVIPGSAAILATETSEGKECQRPPHLHRPCLCTGQKQHFISLPAIFKALLTQPPHSSGDSKETCLKPEAASSASWRGAVPGLAKDKGLWKKLFLLLPLLPLRLFSGNSLVCLSSTSSQMTVGFH